MHADNGGLDHLDGHTTRSVKGIHDAAPDTCAQPANKPVVASGVGPNASGGIVPPRKCHWGHDGRLPKEHHAAYSLASARCRKFVIGEFTAHDLETLRILNHGHPAKHKCSRLPPAPALLGKADINQSTPPAGAVEIDLPRTSQRTGSHATDD